MNLLIKNARHPNLLHKKLGIFDASVQISNYFPSRTMKGVKVHFADIRSQGVWKKPWFGYLFIAVGFILFVGSFWWLPPSGYSVTAMAVLAGIMALRGEISGREKWLWLFILLLFMAIEIRAINKDRKDADEKSSKVLATLTDSVNKQTKAIELSKVQFESTMGEMMGSASYVWFLAKATTARDLPVMMGNDDTIPIRDVDLEIIEIPPKGTGWDVKLSNNLMNPRTIHIGDVKPGFQEAPFRLEPGNYDIRIITRRGMFEERLTALRGPNIPNGWHEDYCVMKYNSNRVLKGTCP